MRFFLRFEAFFWIATISSTCKLQPVWSVQYYVHPQSQENLCPPNSIHVCLTLMEYVTSSSYYFTSSSTEFYFIGSNHHLNESAIFSNLTDIKLWGDVNRTDNAEINCDFAGFKFDHIVNLDIAYLKFSNCSMMVRNEYGEGSLVGLSFFNITDLTVEQVIVQNTIGYGFYMRNIYGYSSIVNSTYQYCKNSARFTGGNVYLKYNRCAEREKISFSIENTTIIDGESRYNNATSPGLYVDLNCSKVNISLFEVHLSGNTVYNDKHTKFPNATQYEDTSIYGGNMALIFEKSFSGNYVQIQNSHFFNGTSFFGGGLFVIYGEQENHLSIETCIFTNNKAYVNGGGIYFVKLQPQASKTISNGDGVKDKTFFKLKSTQFYRNTVKTNKDAGIAVMLIYYYKLQYFSGATTKDNTVIEDCTFQDNYNLPVDSVYSSGSAALYALQQLGKLVIKDSKFIDNEITGLAVFRSLLQFEGYVLIRNNTGYEGGGMVLCEASYFIMSSNTTLEISYNHANITGGGIFAEERCVQVYPLCFYQIGKDEVPILDEFLNTTQIILANNTANYSGSQLYGGTVDDCHIPQINHDIFYQLFHIPKDNDTSKISSDPLSVCFCDEATNHVDCKKSEKNLTGPDAVYSGQAFNVSIVTVGQYWGTVPGVVELKINDSNGSNSRIESSTVRAVSTKCINSSVTIYSNDSNVTVLLRVKNVHANYRLNLNKTYMYVSLKEQPLGLEPVVDISAKEAFKCIDALSNESRGFRCFISENKGHITRPPPFWVGHIEGYNLVVYPYCPQSNCKQVAVNITTEASRFEADMQCAPNHTGILCGRCKDGFSFGIGSATCRNCSHMTLLGTTGMSLLLALVGLLMIFVIVALDLTVTAGTLSGFLFYVNMFFIFSDSFLPPIPNESNDLYRAVKLFKIFIAFINLRFAYDGCFYNGLQVIGKAWIQILLALYLWVLTGAFIWVCKKSSWLATRVTNNSTVPVLATVILLSYTNIYISIIQSLTFARIQLTSLNNNITTFKVVMLYAGDEPYFGVKHIFLFIAASVLALLGTVYTLTLLFIQPLQKYSHFRPLRWVNKLKPLFDAYTCPHIIKPQCRFWTGYLLFFRILLSTFFMLGAHENWIKMSSISISCFLILFTALAYGGVYTKLHLNILSASYFLNIGTLSIIMGYKHQIKNSCKTCNDMKFMTTTSLMSLSLTFVTFVGTCCYHFHRQCMKGRVYGKIRAGSRSLWQLCRKYRNRSYDRAMEQYPCIDEGTSNSYDNDDDDDATTKRPFLAHPNEPSSLSQYREPQLMDFDSESQNSASTARS